MWLVERVNVVYWHAKKCPCEKCHWVYVRLSSCDAKICQHISAIFKHSSFAYLVLIILIYKLCHLVAFMGLLKVTELMNQVSVLKPIKSFLKYQLADNLRHY